MSQALVAPFPHFGGKRRAAPIIWDALGDVGGYVEPFCGSAAALLARPAAKGRRVETLNDADGWLVNAWRAIQHSPASVAAHAAGPVTEIDYHARIAWLQERRTPELVSWLEGDPEAHDPKAVGWWLYVAACGIGDPWEPGPWRVIDGHLTDTRKLPHLGDAGKGDGRLEAYMRALADRLQKVRITCGDWRRVLTPSVTRATAGPNITGILLDPPYAVGADLYAADTDHTISDDVRTWCLTADESLRIVLCGFDADHDQLLDQGWTKTDGKSGGGAGYAKDPKAGRRERLWMSPACHRSQPSLFDGGAA